MRFRGFLILFGIAGGFPSAHADILTLRQNIVAPRGDRVIEVTTFLTETEADRQEVITRLQKSLAEDRAKNPALLVGFEEVVDPKGRAPSSGESETHQALEKVAGKNAIQTRAITAAIRERLDFRYPKWFMRNSRGIFSVARGLINAGVSTWSLMVTQHLPFEVAFAAGVLTGAMSGGLQWFNAELQKYLTSSTLEKFAKAKTLKEGSKFVESVFRWYILEVGFVAAVELALTAMGHPPAGEIVPVIQTGLFTALAAVGAQGTWEIALSMATKRRLQLAKTARALKIVRIRSDFITLGLSALAVTGMVGKINHLAFGDSVFWGMGVSGGAYLVSVLHNEWKCRRALRKSDPPQPMDQLGAPPSETDADLPVSWGNPRSQGDFYSAANARFSAS